MAHQSWEVSIAHFYNSFKKFTVCSNLKCGLIYNCEAIIVGGEDNLLCPKCRAKIETHHIVQCLHCESIVDFIEAEPSEEPVVFTINRCSKCNGSKEEQRNIRASYFPDAFI